MFFPISVQLKKSWDHQRILSLGVEDNTNLKNLYKPGKVPSGYENFQPAGKLQKKLKKDEASLSKRIFL